MKIFLITRPQDQAQGLVNLIEKYGNKALVMPVIKIQSKELEPQETLVLEDLSSYDLAVFISTNAVAQSIPLIKRHLSLTQFNKIKIAVIGPTTKNSLTKFNLKSEIISNQGFNSEGLLKHEELQDVNGKKIVVFRGVGGRELLTTTLLARGARVKSVASYTRCIPKNDVSEIEAMLQHNLIKSVVVMSNESLQNLCKKISKQFLPMLKTVQLVTISQRCAELAQSLGFKMSVIIAESPRDKTIHKCLLKI